MECQAITTVATKSCRNCGRAKVNRPRGLCWTCYYTPGVKDRFPSTSKFARRGEGNFTGNAPMPTIPTTVPPGTPEKLEVLAQRARMKQALWHPMDASYAGDPRPIEWLSKHDRHDLAA